MSNWKTRHVAPFVIVLFCGLIAGCGGGGGGGGEEGGSQVDQNTVGLETLGRGTDVFEEYAVESNVKGQVLDVDALNRRGWLILNKSVEERSYKEVTGNDVSAYASQLSATVGLSGSYMYFSADMRASFSDSRCREEGYSYATIMETNWKHSLKVRNDRWGVDYLKDYLTPEARAALNDSVNWTPERIIQSYGTHVMVGIYIGARLDYHLTSKVVNEQDKTRYDAYASAKYKSLFASATIQAGMTKEEMDSYSSEEERIDIKSKGGDAQYANPQNDADYNAWHDSISVNPVFCGIIKDALIPIWEFAPTEARRQEIMDYYYQYASEQESAFIPLTQKITGIKLYDTGQSSSVTLDPGWSLLQDINGDTAGGFINANIFRGGASNGSNNSPRGDYIWLAVKAEVTDQPGISGVHIASNDPAFNQVLFGGVSHDDLYGADAPGCTANATVNLNAGTCAQGYNNDYYSTCCAVYYWNPKCLTENTLGLYLHYTVQQQDEKAARCVVLGNSISVDTNKSVSDRSNNIYWAPGDVNGDGLVDSSDAEYVLSHVQWVKDGTTGTLVNLNTNTQSYRAYNWYHCAWVVCSDSGWDDGWIHAYEDSRDAQYIGYCVE